MNKTIKFPGFDLNSLTTALAHAVTDLVASGKIQVVPQKGMGKVIDVPSFGTNTHLIGGPGKAPVKRGARPSDTSERARVNAFGSRGIDYKTADIAYGLGLKKENVASLLSVSANSKGVWERVAHGIYRKRIGK